MPYAIAPHAIEKVPGIYRTTESPELTNDPYLNSARNLHAGVDASDFLSAMERSHRATSEVQQLRHLVKGWDSYEAEPPSDWAISEALRIVGAAFNLRMEVTRAIPSADGGIGICFVKGDRYSHIEASNQNELTLVMFSGQELGQVLEIESMSRHSN